MNGPSAAKLQQVLAAYRRLLEARPDDARARLQVARAEVLLGRADEAVREYWTLAQLFVRQGDLLGAINACKSILELSPGHEATQQALRQLLQQQHARSGDAWLPWPQGPSLAAPPAPAAAALDEAALAAWTEGGGPPAAGEPGPLAPAPPPGPQLDTVPNRPAALAPPPLPGAAAPAASPWAGLSTRWQRIAEDMVAEPTRQLQRYLTEPDLGASLDAEGAAGAEASGAGPEDEAASAEELAEIPLLRLLDPEILMELVQVMQRRKLRAGEVALAQGATSGAVLVVAQGYLRATLLAAGRPEISLGRLGRGSFVGESGLLGRQPSPAQYVAEESCDLLVLSNSWIDEYLPRLPRLEKVLSSYALRRRMGALIAASALFRDLPLAEREELRMALRPRHCSDGEEILGFGDPAPPLILVLSGAVAAYAPSPEGERCVGRRGPGEFASIRCAADEQPADRRFVAQGASDLMLLPGSAFRRLLAGYPAVAKAARQLIQLRQLVAERTLG